MKGLSSRLVVRRPEFQLDIELDVEPGCTTALVGPNGAGKSTVVDALAGIVALDDGHLRLDGRTLDDPAAGVFVPPHDRQLGIVFQRFHLFDHLRVRDNVAFGPRARGHSRSFAAAEADRWLSTLGLDSLAGMRPPQLSGGQAQRVALARALAVEPEMLVLDEPMSALDVASRAGLRRELREHLDHVAGPRVLITHEPTDAFLLADRIHVLEDGRITQAGTPEEIRRRPATPYVAALAGRNLLLGTADDGRVTLDDHDGELTAADMRTTGPVLVVVHPNAIALHAEQPHGSPRNSWSTRIDAVEPLGDIVRVSLAGPIPLRADVTPSATAALGLRPGADIWVSIKATEIELTPR